MLWSGPCMMKNSPAFILLRKKWRNGWWTLLKARLQRRSSMTRDSKRWTEMTWCRTRASSITLNRCPKCKSSSWALHKHIWLIQFLTISKMTQSRLRKLKRPGRLFRQFLWYFSSSTSPHTSLSCSGVTISRKMESWISMVFLAPHASPYSALSSTSSYASLLATSSKSLLLLIEVECRLISTSACSGSLSMES